jgi:hypothetical protein
MLFYMIRFSGESHVNVADLDDPSKIEREVVHSSTFVLNGPSYYSSEASISSGDVFYSCIGASSHSALKSYDFSLIGARLRLFSTSLPKATTHRQNGKQAAMRSDKICKEASEPRFVMACPNTLLSQNRLM